LTRFRDLVLDQANTKDIEIVTGEWEHLHLAAVPNKAFIGKTYRAEGPKLLAAFAALGQPELRALRQTVARGEKGRVGAWDVTSEVVSFETRLPEHTSGADFPGGSAYVDTVVTPALQAEGAARDLTRRIQEMRKGLGLAMDAVVTTTVAAPEEFQRLVEPGLAQVASDTRSASIAFVDKPKGDAVREWDLEGTTVTIGVREGAHAAKAAAPPKPKKAPKAKPKKPAPLKKAPPKKAAKKTKPKKKTAAKAKAPKKRAAKKARRK
jgi:isoleucyl-tRNA synthetase